MRHVLIGLAAMAVASPALAQAWPAPAAPPDYACDDRGCWRPQPPPRPCWAGCERAPARFRPDAGYDRDDRVGARRQAYYRDYWPAPQYGYTYGSARGRGYGYNDYDEPAGPPAFYPNPGDW